MQFITFPIFLQDKDKYIYLFTSTDDINNMLEIIDIEEKEYIGWDANGIPLELYVDRGEIKIRTISDNSQSDNLKKAILYYAKIASGKSQLETFKTISNPIELYKEVEKYIKSKSKFQKIKTIFHPRK